MSRQNPILILMGTYNGARFLEAQLQSIAAQSWRHWRLLVSDDGSNDATSEILRAYAARWPMGKLEFSSGPRKGAATNYLQMIAKNTRSGQFIALADQDDVWHPQKLQRAMQYISREKARRSRPVLYGARVSICNRTLVSRALSAPVRARLGLGNALVQNIFCGSTMVLCPTAARIVAEAGVPREPIPFHDWWISLLLQASGARALHDPVPVVSYRQHSGNLIGARRGARAYYRRAALAWSGRYKEWMLAHTRNLAAPRVAPLLTREARYLLAALDDAPKAGLARIRSFQSLGVKRQSVGQTAFLYALAALGRA